MTNCVQLTPRSIKRIKSSSGLSGIGLEIEWMDGSRSTLESQKLRQACPCATCMALRGDQTHSSPLLPKHSSLRVIEADLETEINLVHVRAVGSYGIGLTWGDGHDTGIYTYDSLRSLAEDICTNRDTGEKPGGCGKEHCCKHHNH